MKMSLLLVILSLSIVACNGSGGSSNDKSSAAVRYELLDSTFKDIKVTNGKLVNDSEIECTKGQTVTVNLEIELDGNTSNHSVNTKCNEDFEFSIRRQLILLFDGKTLAKEIGRRKVLGMISFLDFMSSSFDFDIEYRSLYKAGWQGVIANNSSRCYMDYVFSEDGKVKMGIFDKTHQTWIDNEGTNYNHMIYGDHIPKDSNNNIGCLTDEIQLSSGHYRYSNGKLEIDESGTRRFSPNGCGKFDGETFELLDYKENGDFNGNCPDAGYETTLEKFCIDSIGYGC